MFSMNHSRNNSDESDDFTKFLTTSALSSPVKEISKHEEFALLMGYEHPSREGLDSPWKLSADEAKSQSEKARDQERYAKIAPTEQFLISLSDMLNPGLAQDAMDVFYSPEKRQLIFSHLQSVRVERRSDAISFIRKIYNKFRASQLYSLGSDGDDVLKVGLIELKTAILTELAEKSFFNEILFENFRLALQSLKNYDHLIAAFKAMPTKFNDNNQTVVLLKKRFIDFVLSCLNDYRCEGSVMIYKNVFSLNSLLEALKQVYLSQRWYSMSSNKISADLLIKYRSLSDCASAVLADPVFNKQCKDVVDLFNPFLLQALHVCDSVEDEEVDQTAIVEEVQGDQAKASILDVYMKSCFAKNDILFYLFKREERRSTLESLMLSHDEGSPVGHYLSRNSELGIQNMSNFDELERALVNLKEMYARVTTWFYRHVTDKNHFTIKIVYLEFLQKNFVKIRANKLPIQTAGLYSLEKLEKQLRTLFIASHTKLDKKDLQETLYHDCAFNDDLHYYVIQPFERYISGLCWVAQEWKSEMTAVVLGKSDPGKSSVVRNLEKTVFSRMFKGSSDAAPQSSPVFTVSKPQP